MKRTLNNELKSRSRNEQAMTTAVKYQGRRIKDPAVQHVEQINAISRNAGAAERQSDSYSGEGDEDESDVTNSHRYQSGEGEEDEEEGNAEDNEDDDEEDEEEDEGERKEHEVYGKSHAGALYYDSQDELSEEGDYAHDDEDDDEGHSNEGEDRDSFSDSTVDSDVEIDEEISKFIHSFPELEVRYKFLEKIGEGTFSSVYKAIDLHYDRYFNAWDIDRLDDSTWASPPLKSKRHNSSSSRVRRKKKYVAVKKIYVTSSPTRIQNELELLRDLSGCENVVSLITAFRSDDQVVAVMPYFKHVDFREYFREFDTSHIRSYFKPLFRALEHVHALGILHRDIKPTNFLYDVQKRRGVLVDFGLAERQEFEGNCLCQHSAKGRKETRLPQHFVHPTGCYPKNDSRPARRANRAGTRGFRAPEVLFKCPAQTTKIDIWSAGVILLTFLARRFPFFNSTDDIDAVIEIATIFGKAKMRNCAVLHGTTFEANLSTLSDKGFSLEKVILWATTRQDDDPLNEEELLAVRFLHRCMELDPYKRISASEALEHEFLSDNGMYSDDEVDMVAY